MLDRFSRNIHRDTPRAFASDPMAVALTQEAVRAGAPETLSPIDRNFLYMPFMHSESRAIHALADALLRDNGLESKHDFARRHCAIIDHFGRYPRNNAILGHTSSAE